MTTVKDFVKELHKTYAPLSKELPQDLVDYCDEVQDMYELLLGYHATTSRQIACLLYSTWRLHTNRHKQKPLKK